MVGLEELYIRLAGCWVAGANLLVFEVYVEEAVAEEVEVDGEGKSEVKILSWEYGRGVPPSS